MEPHRNCCLSILIIEFSDISRITCTFLSQQLDHLFPNRWDFWYVNQNCCISILIFVHLFDQHQISLITNHYKAPCSLTIIRVGSEKGLKVFSNFTYVSAGSGWHLADLISCKRHLWRLGARLFHIFLFGGLRHIWHFLYFWKIYLHDKLIKIMQIDLRKHSNHLSYILQYEVT